MNIIKNRFFQKTWASAARLTGKPGRVVSLLTKLSVKIYQTQWSSINAETVRSEFILLGRLLRAHVTGAYKIQSVKLLVALIATVLYFVNPFDLIPDALFGVGLMDDFAVLTWVYRLAKTEIDSFKIWEANSVVAEL